MILLITILTIALISVLGMFYWMYKARNGELNLSTNSWHYKLKHWMWDFETYEGKNACPYYWGLVFSMLILPLYSIIRGLVYLYSKRPKIKLPTVNLPHIPETKKEVYNKIYKNSKKWLFYILIFSLLAFLIYIFYLLFKTNVFGFKFIISSIVISGLIAAQNTLIPEWDEYFIEPVINIGKGLVDLIKLPFLIIYNLLAIVFRKLFNIYTDMCPPIIWDNEENNQLC